MIGLSKTHENILLMWYLWWFSILLIWGILKQSMTITWNDFWSGENGICNPHIFIPKKKRYCLTNMTHENIYNLRYLWKIIMDTIYTLFSLELLSNTPPIQTLRLRLIFSSGWYNSVRNNHVLHLTVIVDELSNVASWSPSYIWLVEDWTR